MPMREGRDGALRSANPWALAGLFVGAGVAGCLVRSALQQQYSFRGKSVLITGGSRGLGLEMSRLLAEEGANLVIVGRNAATLEAARAQLEGFGCVHVIPCGIDTQLFQPAPDAQRQKRNGHVPLIVCVARLAKVKRLTLLLFIRKTSQIPLPDRLVVVPDRHSQAAATTQRLYGVPLWPACIP